MPEILNTFRTVPKPQPGRLPDWEKPEPFAGGEWYAEFVRCLQHLDDRELQELKAVAIPLEQTLREKRKRLAGG